jgi:hypothetical protein
VVSFSRIKRADNKKYFVNVMSKRRKVKRSKTRKTLIVKNQLLCAFVVESVLDMHHEQQQE